MFNMKRIIFLKEAAQWGICLLAIQMTKTGLHAWLLIYFFMPDLFAAGYLLNNKTGAFLYNLAHFKFTGLLVVLAGIGWHADFCVFTGLVLYAHSSFDRMLGYGLKFPDSPHHTHLGYTGKTQRRQKSISGEVF